MHTLRSQRSKSTRSSSRKRKKLLTVASKTVAAPIKAKKPSLAINSKSSSTKSRHPVTKHGGFMCKAPGCNFTSKYNFCLQRHAACHGNPSVPSRRSESTKCSKRENFKCNKCSYATAQKGNLNRHFATHSTAQPFNLKSDTPNFGCHYCEYRSRWNHNVRAHERRKHSGIPSQVSGLKKMNKSDEVTVRKVVRTLQLRKAQQNKCQLDTLRISSAEPSPDESFRCKDCDHVSKSKRLLISHMENHHLTERDFPCTFPGCSYRSNLSQWARAHERRAHGFTRLQHLQQVKSKAQRQSTRASKASKSPNVQVVKRIRRPPRNKNPARFSSASAAPSKQISVKGYKEKVQCPQCEHKCHQRFLHLHLKVHSNEKPFVCSVKGCSYRTRWPADLRTHMKRHEKGPKTSPPSAPVSSRNATRKSSCRTSKSGTKTIATPEIVKQFKCPDCEFRGKTTWHVNRHRQTHGNIPPLRCPEFRCRFKTRDGRHLVKHRLECRSKGRLSRPQSLPTLQLNSTEQGCRFCGCKKKSHAMKTSKGLRGRKQPLAVDQPEVGKELTLANDHEETKEIIEEALIEPVVELTDSTGFACMLCEFVGYSERAALEHAQCHTRPPFPIDQLNEIPVICLD